MCWNARKRSDPVQLISVPHILKLKSEYLFQKVSDEVARRVFWQAGGVLPLREPIESVVQLKQLHGFPSWDTVSAILGKTF